MTGIRFAALLPVPSRAASTSRVSPVDARLPTRALSVARGNSLLDSMEVSALARVAAELESVHLERKEVLFRAHEPLQVVYFPISAVISFVVRLETGETLEVGMVGRDGLAGTAVFPGMSTMSCDGIVQIPGVALRIGADTLRREIRTVESLQVAIGRFSQALLLRSMQTSACNMFHSVEQRCIRWLLTVNDVVHDDAIPLTHELVAMMLGVHRPTVTLTLRNLQRAGLLDEARGRVVIRDRRRLEAACCECYRVMVDEQRRLLGY